MLARRIAVALLFVAAGVAAWVSTAGPTAVPASPWVTGGALVAVAALLAAMTRWPTASRWVVPLAVLALALVATQIHFREGFPRTHDSRLHLWSLWSVHRCLLDGDLFPRWNPYMGLGYPLLQFYPPASYLAGQPFLFFGMSPAQTGATLVVLTSLGSGLTTWWAARRFGASRPASLVAAGLLILAPYHLHDANFRFALAEVAAFVLLAPFLVLGREVVLGAPEGRKRGGWLFLGVATLLLVTHLLTALMAGVFVGLWVLVEGALRGPRSYPRAGLGLLRMGGLCVLAAGLVGFFIVPAMLEMDQTSIGRFLPGSNKPLSGNGIALPDLVERYGWTGYAAKRLGLPEGKDPNHVIPMYFGLTWLICLPAALVLAIARRRPVAGLTGAAVAGLSVASVASLLFSAGIPALLLDGIPPLRSLQFPWRFLGPAAVGTSLAAAVVVDGLVRSGRLRAAFAGVLLLAAAVDSFPYQGACDWHDAYRGASHQKWSGPGATYAERHEPVNARLPEATFVRVERLRFPPTEFRWRVAQAFRCHREYMTRKIFNDYVKKGVRENDRDVSARYGVHRVYRTSEDQPEILDAAPLGAFRTMGGAEYVALETRPEIRGGWIVATLPENHPGGELRLLFQAFPGWIYRVDGGDWEKAQDFDGLLGATVTEGARRVHLKFSWRTPARRAGLGITLLCWCVLCVAGWRRLRPGSGARITMVALTAWMVGFPVASHAEAPVLVPQLGHFGNVTAVDFSPDGRLVLTGGWDGRVVLWDFESGLELRGIHNFGYEGESLFGGGVRSVEFSLDGTSVLALNHDGRFERFDTATWSAGGCDVAGEVTAAGFAREGHRLALVIDGTQLLVFDENCAEIARISAGPGREFEDVTWSPGGDRIATIESGSGVLLWNHRSGRQFRFDGPPGLDPALEQIQQVEFSPDGRFLCVGAGGPRLLKLEIPAGRWEEMWTGGAALPLFMEFALDPRSDTLVLSLDANGAVVWNLGTNTVTQASLPGLGAALAIRPGGRYLLNGEFGGAVVWDLEIREQIRHFHHGEFYVNGVFVDDASRTIVEHRYDSLMLWQQDAPPAHRSIWAGKFRKQHLVCARGDLLFEDGSGEQPHRLVDIPSGELLEFFFLPGEERLTAVAIHPDGRSVILGASGFDPGDETRPRFRSSVKIRDIREGAYVSELPVHGRVHALSVSDDGSLLLLVFDGAAHVWDLVENRVSAPFLFGGADDRRIALSDPGNADEVEDAAWSPDGTRFAVSTEAGTVVVFERATAAKRTVAAHRGSARQVVFSDDGQFVLSAGDDGFASRTSVESGETVKRYEGHVGVVHMIDVLAEEIVVTGSMDGTIRLWDYESGSPVATLLSYGEDSWAVVDPLGRFDGSDQGLLTYALLEGMKGAALEDGTSVRDTELFTHAVERVPELARSLGLFQEPQTFVRKDAVPFTIGMLTPEDREAIPLAEPGPRILRPQVLEPDNHRDPLGLALPVRQAVRNHEMTGTWGSVTYVDAEKLDGSLEPQFVYRIEEGQVHVTGKLWEGSEEVSSFEIVRAFDGTDEGREALAIELADRLLEAVVALKR